MGRGVNITKTSATVAQLVERGFRKAGVVGSNPIGGSQIYYKENNAGSNIKNQYQIVPKNV